MHEHLIEPAPEGNRLRLGFTQPYLRTSSRIDTLEISSVRRDLVGSGFCSLVGVFLCALPHGIWLFILDEPVWAADQDELYYLGVAGQAFFDHPLWLGDPTRHVGPSLYQGLPLLPGVWIARLLRLGPQLISLAWRCWGGGLAGLAQTHLRYVWLPPGHAPPGDRAHWSECQDGPFWAIWEHDSFH
jgi:hypothetical protein